MKTLSELVLEYRIEFQKNKEDNFFLKQIKEIIKNRYINDTETLKHLLKFYEESWELNGKWEYNDFEPYWFNDPTAVSQNDFTSNMLRIKLTREFVDNRFFLNNNIYDLDVIRNDYEILFNDLNILEIHAYKIDYLMSIVEKIC